MRVSTKFLSGGAAVAALLSAGAALAQEAPATADATAAGQATQPGDTIADVVVTAERRSENLQKVPVSVGVVGGADLRAFQSGGDDTLLSLSGRVPSLYTETTTGRIFPRFYIRGLGNIDFYLGASQPVTIIQDDVVLEHVVLKSNPVFDVGQVEVLRGRRDRCSAATRRRASSSSTRCARPRSGRAAPRPATPRSIRVPSTPVSAAR